jgi:hypothetical protein
MTINSIMSDWLENTIIQWVLREGDSPTEATMSGSGPWLALYTTCPWDSGSGTEVSGNNYKRVQLPNIFSLKPTSASITGATYFNSASIVFEAATGAWGTVTHVGITTACLSNAAQIGTGVTSELLYYGELEETVSPVLNDRFQIPKEDFEITVKGAYSAYLAGAILASSLNNADTNIGSGTTRYLAVFSLTDSYNRTPYEPDDPAYARQSFSIITPQWQNWISGSTANLIAKNFPYATQDWGWIAAVGIYNTNTYSANQHLLYYSELGSGSRIIYEGDRISFPVGSIIIGADNDSIPGMLL